MARPQKNNLDYYPHDNNMRNDRKIKALRTKFGLTGYAIYNMLLETLCEQDLLILYLDENELELVSGDFTIVSDELTRVIDYLCHIKLLKRVNNYLFCSELDRRSEGVFGKRTNNLSDLRIGKGINVTETGVFDSETPQSKVKESKEYKYSSFYDNEIKKNKTKNNINDYNLFVDYLYGNNELKKPLNCWLSLRDQLTYDQFYRILKKPKKQKVKDMLMSGYNKPKYLKGLVSFYSTLNSWINRNG